MASPEIDQAIPERLGTFGAGSLLGQIRDAEVLVSVGDAAATGQPDRRQLLAATLDLAERRALDEEALPAPWLERVGGEFAFQRRAEHLYYLAGYWHPSRHQMEIARLLREESTDDPEALQRLWWLLSHQQ